MDYRELVNKAMEARQNAYSPYSRFKVGSALLTGDGKVYTGVNIENASYGLTVCAERTALFKAVSEGVRKISALAVACDTDAYNSAFPCGACRQVMAEFLDDEADIIISVNTGEYKIYKLKELLPHAFRLSDV
jgi:cytidine deaminase